MPSFHLSKFEIPSWNSMSGCHKDLCNEMITRRMTGLGTGIDLIHRTTHLLEFPVEMTIPIP
jgi:hypothetical protein